MPPSALEYIVTLLLFAFTFAKKRILKGERRKGGRVEREGGRVEGGRRGKVGTQLIRNATTENHTQQTYATTIRNNHTQ